MSSKELKDFMENEMMEYWTDEELNRLLSFINKQHEADKQRMIEMLEKYEQTVVYESGHVHRVIPFEDAIKAIKDL